MIDLGVFSGLFAAAFLAATIVPGTSEAGLAALVLAGGHPLWALVAVASVGNTLGSAVNWWLGRGVDRLAHRRWFPVSMKRLDQASGWYRRYGRWSLLLSWAPVIGDPLTLAAGVMREPLASFIALVALAKTARYVAVAALALNWIEIAG